jgi:hypothetical protein
VGDLAEAHVRQLEADGEMIIISAGEWLFVCFVFCVENGMLILNLVIATYV